jgi:hypothetical protein
VPKEAGMKGMLGLLKVAMIGFALVAGGRALWKNKDKVMKTWNTLGGVEGIKGYADKLSVSKLIETIGPLKGLVSQMTHLK